MERRTHTNPDGTNVNIFADSGAWIDSGARIGSGARIETPLHYVDGGMRRDGYRFSGYLFGGDVWITAGCRVFLLPQARSHWSAPDYREKGLGEEAIAIIDHIERIFALRGLTVEMEAA